MEPTSYRVIPEELWQQGDPPTEGALLALVRWESLPEQGGDTQYVYAVLDWMDGDWSDDSGWCLDFTYPDTVCYIVLKP